MVDYKKFLAKSEELVLPYLGGGRVDAPARRLRLQGRPPEVPGWYTFRVQGQRATLLGPGDPPDMSERPRRRGHLLPGGRLVVDGAETLQLELMPADDPELFAPATAREWVPEVWLFEGLEFESEAEEAARSALEARGTLAEIKGVGATLRAAWVFALADAAAREAGVEVEAIEGRGRVLSLAAGGWEAAQSELERIRAARAAWQAAREREQRLQALGVDVEALRESGAAGALPTPAASSPRHPNRGDRRPGRARQADPETRAEEALEAAGARLLRVRRLQSGRQLEVVYRFRGTRFSTLVDPDTLQVIDSGICLEGSDSALTLQSLPGAIREAMDTGQLYIMRHVRD